MVKPNNKITNYLTQYSGITASKLKDITTTLSDVQEVIIKLLPPDAILVGQSLNCDLEALKVNNVFNLKQYYLKKNILKLQIFCCSYFIRTL